MILFAWLDLVLVEHKQVQTEADKHVGEPGDVFVVVSESVVLVSLEIWIVIVAKLTINLNGEEEQARAKNLEEEHDELNTNPHLGVAEPEIWVLHGFSSCVRLVENCKQNATEVEDHLDCVKDLIGEAMLCVGCW